METLEFRGINLDDCPNCGGIWFDDGELKKLQNLTDPLSIQSLEGKASPLAGAAPPERENKLCPVCNERLTPYRYMYTSDIELDECDNCFGVWVQEGELAKMEAYSRDHAGTLDPAKREVFATASADAIMAMRSKKNRAKSLVAFWSHFGLSRPGRPQ